MPFDVVGKVALVTGANRGIGKQFVETLFARGASKVYAAVRDLKSAQPLVDKHGDKVEPVQLDLQQPETIRAAAAKCQDVQLVVNNAGVLRNADPLADDVLDALGFEMEVNVHGLLRMARAFAPVLANGGALVQLNSVASLRSFAPFATYCASKAASYSLTQALRDVLQEQNTQVVSVHPGPIDTDMADQAGLEDVDPPSAVTEATIAALAAGEFHVFPDKMAKEMGEAYQGFAEAVVEAAPLEA